MKKTAIVVGVLVTVLLVGGYLYISGKEYVLRFSEAEIEETLANKLPMTKTYLFIIQVTLDNPRVLLENGSNRVNAGLDVKLNVTINDSTEPLGGSIDVSGGVRYLPEEGQFFLSEPIVEQIRVQGVSPVHTDKVNVALTKALAEFYAERPIYTLSDFDAKQVAVQMVLKNVIVENKELVITLGI
jgi:hypothetical protein